MSASTYPHVRPWEYPSCPECGGHVFVEHVHPVEWLREWPSEDTFYCYAGWCDGEHFVAPSPLSRRD